MLKVLPPHVRRQLKPTVCDLFEAADMKKALLSGIAALLLATGANAQSSGPGGGASAFGGGLTGGFRSGPRLAVPPPDPRRVACLRANGVSPVQHNQHVIAMAIRRCLRSGHR